MSASISFQIFFYFGKSSINIWYIYYVFFYFCIYLYSVLLILLFKLKVDISVLKLFEISDNHKNIVKRYNWICVKLKKIILKTQTS